MGAAPPEDRVPVVRNADNSPVAFCSSFQGLFRAADVVELSVVVVVQDKQTEGGPVQLLGELRYRDVAVGVAGEYGASPGSAPDAYQLLGPVIEGVGLHFVVEGAAVLATDVLECRGAADDPFAWNAVEVLGHWADEVAARRRRRSC
jgi:hypothetical protein